MNGALIGVGYWGVNYLRLLQTIENVKLAYVADISNRALERVKTPNEIKKTEDLNKVIEDPIIDFVVVTTPASTHYSLVSKLIRAGKSVLVEKPLTMSHNEANELIDLAYRERVTLLTGHTYLYNSAYRYIKGLIKSGRFGKIHYVYGERMGLGPIRNDASCLWDLGVHDVSMALDLMGDLPDNKAATTIKFIKKDSDASDFASFYLSYNDNTIFSFNVSWYSPYKVRLWTIVCDKAMITFNDMNSDFPITIVKNSINAYGNANEYSQYYTLGDVIKPKIERSEPLRNLMEVFLNKIEKKDYSPDLGSLQVVKVMEELAGN